MQKWEYYELGAMGDASVMSGTGVAEHKFRSYKEAIARLGNEGWEMVGVGVYPSQFCSYYFKRPLS